MKKTALSIVLASSLSMASITGTVYKDFNNNGTMDGGDAPLIGAPVKATCNNGQTYQAVTNGKGEYTLNTEAGVKCRVEVDAQSVGFGSGTNAPGSAPLVDFVSDGETHNVSVGSPATYCQPNPDVIMATLPGYFTRGKFGAGGGESPFGQDFGSVFKVPAPQNGDFNNNKTIPSKRTTIAKFDDTGAIWGAAWKKGTKELFVSAALKRYVPLKDESSPTNTMQSAGTIYKIDTKTNPATVTPFAVVPNALTEDAANKLSNRDYGYNKDLDVINYTGRMGLGDLEISEDETKLYTINMNTKSLVVIDANNGSILDTVSIPNPYPNGQCDNEKVRPWALKVKGNDVFIGSVCEDKIDNGNDDNTDDLGAAVQKYDGSNFTTVAITDSLRYLRPPSYGAASKDTGSGYRYTNWTDPWSDAPMLTDIEFTNKGDLVLGYNSRSTYNRYGSLRGDIRRMCLKPNGTYVDELSEVGGDASCVNDKGNQVKHDSKGKNQTTYYEYYVGDYFGNGNYGGQGHPDTASGALAQAPGAPNIIVGMIDGTDWWQPGAIGNYDNTNGDKIGAQAVIDNRKIDDGGEREPYAAKAGGMGDVELLCDPAPIEIGDLVWIDVNQNGIQDGGEPPYPNVPVKLECKENGSYVEYGSVNTDSKGHYYFGGPTNANLNNGKTLTAGMNCKIVVAKDDVNGKPATQPQNADSNDTIDSDAKEVGNNNVIEFTTTNKNDHTLDMGIEPTIGCLTGVLFEDVNGNGTEDAGDARAPKNITVKITDSFGNVYTAETDDQGEFALNQVPAGSVKVEVDTTDTDIPEGANWSVQVVDINVSEGTPPTCAATTFTYKLPAPVDQDPKDSAVCANPTSLTWKGANVSTASVWTNPAVNTPKTFTTVGGATVDVTMKIINDNGGEYNQASSGTSAAFGEPYLTLYLGDQDNPGNGTWDDAANCATNGYDLEAGESYQLEVDFNESVVLDNWRIRDVDSGDVRNNESNWEWQDGIKVEAFDADGNPVEIETKIGSSGAGLIKDSNGIVHTDKDNYDAGGGDFATGEGTTPNSTNGHIVLTSNFKPIKKLVITHVAGPDIPCQTRSALAMAGFAVCKPLHISGTVYDDSNGVKSCAENGKVDGTPISSVEGNQLNACLIDSNSKVIDTMPLVNGSYDFYNGIKPNTKYKVLITTNSCVVGSAAPAAKLPEKWNYEGEKIDPTNNCGDDGNKDGKIEVNVATSNVLNVDFSINKTPTAKGGKRPIAINQPGDTPEKIIPDEFCDGTIDPIEDYEQNDINKITLISVSGTKNSKIIYNGTEYQAGDTIDFSAGDPCDLLRVIPDGDGDVVTSFTYKVIDDAGRESDPATITAPFRAPSISGYLYLDSNNDGQVNGTPTANSCDGTTPLYVNLIDSNNKVKAVTTLDSADGHYAFYNPDVVAENNYTLVLSTTQGTIGNDAPQASLPNGCAFVKENKGGTEDNPEDGLGDGKITVNLKTEDIPQLNFSITPTVCIGNFVWEDKNANGIQDAGEEGIEGVRVTLKDENDQNVTNAFGENVAPVDTNSTGGYKFCNLLPNKTYKVVFTKPTGYYVTTKDNGNDDAKDSDIANDNLEVTVNVGTDDDLTIDAGFFKPACIGNFVWEDKNANGIQDNGEEPINGAKVKLYKEDGTTPATKLDGGDAQQDTNATGNYHICNLRPGKYVVEITKPDNTNYYYTRASSNNDLDGANKDNDSNIKPELTQATSGKSVVVELSSGEDDLTWDAGLFKPACIGNYIWEDKNANGIQDEDESGVSGVEITLTSTDGANSKDLAGNNLPRTITTENNGTYKFCNLVPGKYKVSVTKLPDGYVVSRQDKGSDDSKDSDIDTFLNKNGGNMPEEILSSGEDNDTFDGGIFKPACLGDFAFKDKNANGIQDNGDLPLKDVNVTIIPVADDAGYTNTKDINGNDLGTILTDENGKYEFCNLIPGKYKVSFQKDPDSNGAPFISTKENATDDNNDSDIPQFKEATNGNLETPVATLQSGDNNDTLDAGFIQEICLGNKVWMDENLNGVQDNNEKGISNLKVIIVDENGNRVKDVYGNEVAPTYTDKKGNFEFCHLYPARDYNIKVAVPKGYKVSPKNKGSKNVDSDANEDGEIFVDMPLRDDMTLAMGLYCECDDYKVHPEKYKKVSANALNLLGLLASFTLLIFAARRRG